MKNRFTLPVLAILASLAGGCTLKNTNLDTNNAPEERSPAMVAKQANSGDLLEILKASHAALRKNIPIMYNTLQNIDAPSAESIAILNIGTKMQHFDRDIYSYDHARLSQIYLSLADSLKAQNAALKFAPMLGEAKFKSLGSAEKQVFLETICFDVLANYHDVLTAFLKKERLLIQAAAFTIGANSAKPAIVLGDEYRAEIGICAPTMLEKFSISVNGGSLPVKEGKAIYRTKPSKIGEQKYTANVNLTNPMTGEVIKVTKEMYFNVGMPMAFIEKEGANILYLGEENELTVLAAGFSSNDIGVTASGTAGLQILPAGKSTYTVRVKQKGTAALTISYKKSGKTLGVYTFEVKTR